MSCSWATVSSSRNLFWEVINILLVVTETVLASCPEHYQDFTFTKSSLQCIYRFLFMVIPARSCNKKFVILREKLLDGVVFWLARELTFSLMSGITTTHLAPTDQMNTSLWIVKFVAVIKELKWNDYGHASVLLKVNSSQWYDEGKLCLKFVVSLSHTNCFLLRLWENPWNSIGRLVDLCRIQQVQSRATSLFLVSNVWSFGHSPCKMSCGRSVSAGHKALG